MNIIYIHIGIYGYLYLYPWISSISIITKTNFLYWTEELISFTNYSSRFRFCSYFSMETMIQGEFICKLDKLMIMLLQKLSNLQIMILRPNMSK